MHVGTLTSTQCRSPPRQQCWPLYPCVFFVCPVPKFTNWCFVTAQMSVALSFTLLLVQNHKFEIFTIMFIYISRSNSHCFFDIFLCNVCQKAINLLYSCLSTMLMAAADVLSYFLFDRTDQLSIIPIFNLLDFYTLHLTIITKASAHLLTIWINNEV